MRHYDVLYLPEAKQDIKDINDYISTKLGNPASAVKIAHMILERCERLSVFPNGYSIRFHSHGQAIRFVHFGSYTIAYYVDDKTDTVTIYAIKYSRMNLGKLLG